MPPFQSLPMWRGVAPDLTPVAEIMPDRCTPDYERTVAKMGSVLPYRRARSLLDEFLPLGDTPGRWRRSASGPCMSAPGSREAATLLQPRLRWPGKHDRSHLPSTAGM